MVETRHDSHRYEAVLLPLHRNFATTVPEQQM